MDEVPPPSSGTCGPRPRCVLIGPPATGKSTVAPLVASALRSPWVDLDEIASPYYAEAGWSPAMLVSGVGREVKDAELAAQFDIPDRLMRCCITLGYDAVDTRTNAEETAAWIAANDVKSIRLVSADYHMRRAASDLRRQVGPDVTILRDAVHTEPSLAMLFLEYHKLLIGWVAALFNL